MRGLLRKDWILTKKYFRASMLIVLLVLVIGTLNPESGFYGTYSAVMGGILSVSLLGYDEKEHWLDYTDTLPLSPKTIVRARYLVGLLFSTAATVLGTVSYAVGCVLHRDSDFSTLPVMAILYFCSSIVPSITLMPVVVRFGMEKGRLMYYAIFAIMFGIFAVMGLLGKAPLTTASMPPVYLLLPIVCILWFGSLLLSQRLYPKRER